MNSKEKLTRKIKKFDAMIMARTFLVGSVLFSVIIFCIFYIIFFEQVRMIEYLSNHLNNSSSNLVLTLFRMGFFGAADG